MEGEEEGGGGVSLQQECSVSSDLTIQNMRKSSGNVCWLGGGKTAGGREARREGASERARERRRRKRRREIAAAVRCERKTRQNKVSSLLPPASHRETFLFFLDVQEP